MEQHVSLYILNHLQIKVNGQIQSLELSGYQQEAESTWNYFEIKNVGQVKKIEINNTILHDYKEEQINMLHIKANGKDFTDKLDFPSSFYERNFLRKIDFWFPALNNYLAPVVSLPCTASF
jgi:hypothetical protein